MALAPASTVIQWDLLGNSAATEAEDSPAPQKVPPIPKRPCPLASSFLSSVFQRGGRLATVLQLEADRRKWAWAATGGTSVSGSRCGGVWRQVVGPRRTLGGCLVKRGEDGTMPGGGTGWFVINRQGGYFTGVERFSRPATPAAGFILMSSTPRAFYFLISEEVYSVTIGL